MIVVVVPSNRPDRLKEFEAAWKNLFDEHDVELVRVMDGDDPKVILYDNVYSPTGGLLSNFPAPWGEVVFNHNDGVRNLGFLFASWFWKKELKIIITLDDDVLPPPHCDPIQEHLDALDRKYPVSWLSTASEYTRGFPYGAREEAECWVSHGVWSGVHDYDAPTQLVKGNVTASFFQGVIPKGCLFPCCGMNLAFKAEALPYLYFAPMGPKVGVHRFADIWMGLAMKRALDDLGKAVVTGCSVVEHRRASDVFRNLEQEAKGIRWNEYYWRGGGLPKGEEKEYGDYFSLHINKYNQWQEIVKGLMQ